MVGQWKAQEKLEKLDSIVKSTEMILEGWSLAEIFNVRCVVAAPYVVPYSAPSSFERKFSEDLPLLYDFLQEASSDKNTSYWLSNVHVFVMSTVLGYWPSNVHVYGFWSLPMEWQFSCKQCAEVTVLTTSENWHMKAELCSAHTELQKFLNAPASLPPVFIGLSSIGR
ncbi:UDP-glucuronosyl/UDP-glucosyltransferase [Artemisia annua]|uniref:UDP-glucuronosyl/UDP-glucosyltransferase n=1 Tax=Artemisia annua TaxID=35608 RepID=A0A2U1LZ83_ARTAN|nr:UDP-glucuronosyl/UDP-glucosyltransferase [Artemisia annua]